MDVTLYSLALRYVGIKELAGAKNHPLIQWWHSLVTPFEGDLEIADEVSWCSSALNAWAWELRLPRSKSAMARSWLNVGVPVPLAEARVGFDVVVLWRGQAQSITGHVGLFSGLDGDRVFLLGGNQDDQVSVAPFPVERVLGVRRLA